MFTRVFVSSLTALLAPSLMFVTSCASGDSERATQGGAESLAIGVAKVDSLAVSSRASLVGAGAIAPTRSKSNMHMMRTLSAGQQIDGGTLVRAQSYNVPPFNAPRFSYYGGRVISNVQIVQVNWNSGNTFATYITDGEIAGYYAGIVNSPFIDQLTEYDTNGVQSLDGSGSRPQLIRRGSFGGVYAITPNVTGTSITDEQIQAELASQIDDAALPQPTADAHHYVDTIYFVHFPQGTTIISGGQTSCNNFCAYHSTFVHGGGDIYYAVMPDMSPGSGCDTRCVANATPFQSTDIVASHELAESITDPQIGLATPGNLTDAGVPELYPVAWDFYVDQLDNGEIGDVCERTPSASVVDGNGKTWTVQRVWSMAMSECMASHLANGGFETGDLTDWSSGGTAATTPIAHSGASGLALGLSTAPTRASNASQTFDLLDPFGGGTVSLSVWVSQVCLNPQLGWGTVQLIDSATNNVIVPPTPFCSGSSDGSWHQMSFDVTAYHGHTVTLVLGNWDDPNSSQRTTTFFDDVTTTRNPPNPSNPIVDPSFDIFPLTPPWTVTGTATLANFRSGYPVYTGTYSVETGADQAPSSGDSTVSQAFTAQAAASTIALHVYPICPDVVSNDWITVTLQDSTTGLTATLLPKACTNNAAWTTVAGAVTAGHSYTLTMTSHDNGVPGTGTYAFWDDVSVQ